jgi:fatty acid desaturase
MLSLPELAVLGFAAARGTQLVVFDSILDGPRERLELWHARKFKSKPRTLIRDLVSCIFCTGFWASVAATAVYILASPATWPGIWLFGIDVFAVAGAQMVINKVVDHL